MAEPQTPHSRRTAQWNLARQQTLKLVEVRGALPPEIACPDTGLNFNTGPAGGNVPKKATFACQSPTCGKEQKVLDSTKQTGTTGPLAEYAIQGYCPECDTARLPYSGRFFATPSAKRLNAACVDWSQRSNSEFDGFWPTCELSYGWKTHGWGIPDHGYTHYWKMFSPDNCFPIPFSYERFGIALAIAR